VAKRNLAELTIPASPEFISVAKRVATTLGGQLDLGLPSNLKLTYFATNRALVVDVDLMPTGAALPVPAQAHVTHIDPELQRLAYEMIRCFVDDFRPVIEPRTGHVSFRMVKHLAG